MDTSALALDSAITNRKDATRCYVGYVGAAWPPTLLGRHQVSEPSISCIMIKGAHCAKTYKSLPQHQFQALQFQPAGTTRNRTGTCSR